jgi:SPP1 family phage portal protein
MVKVVDGTDIDYDEFSKTLNLYMSAWWASQTRANRIKSREYYNGIQDIRFKKRNFIESVYNQQTVSTKLTNTTLTYNIYKKIIDQRAGYALDRQMRIFPEISTPEEVVDNKIEDSIEQSIEDSEDIGPHIEIKDSGPNDKFTQLVAHINALFGKEWKLKLRQALIDCLIDGEVFLYPYIEDGKFKMRFFRAQDSLAIYKDDTEDEIQQFIRVFTVNTLDKDEKNVFHPTTGVGYVEMYTEKGIVRFQNYGWAGRDASSLVLENPQFVPYIAAMGNMRSGLTLSSSAGNTALVEGLTEPEDPMKDWSMPILRIRYTSQAVPFLMNCKEIVDQINYVYSNFIDLIRDNPDNAIIKLINYDGDQDDLLRIREEIMVNRIVSLRNLPGAPEGDFEIVDMPIHTEDYRTLLGTLHSALFEVTGAFDDTGGDTDVLHGRIQSTGAQLSLIMMDQSANTLLRSVELALERLVNDFYVPFLKKATGEDYSDMPIVIDYSENTVQNTSELLNTLVSLGLEVSNETLLSMVPFVPNVRTEMKRLINEQNLKLALQTKQEEAAQEKQMEAQETMIEERKEDEPIDDDDENKENEDSSQVNQSNAPPKPAGKNQNPFRKQTPGTGSPNGGGKRADVAKTLNKSQAER